MVVTRNCSETIKSNSTFREAGELDIINSSSDHRCVFPLFKKGLRIACHNINRLITADHTDKLDEILIHLENVQYNPLDVYGLCETFLNKSRLLLYIANGLNYKHRVDLEDKWLDTVETIWIELRLTSKLILVCLIYFPPKYNQIFTTEWINSMVEHISLAFSENKQIILMGDLNIDFQSDRQYKKSVKTAWQDLVSNYNLNQIVQKPTRVTEQTQSLIDHIFIQVKPI